MKYKQILKELSRRNNLPPKEIEKEMKKALVCAGLNCSVKEFIENASVALARQTIYRNTV